MSKIAIIGAGAWGTALAMVAQRAGNEVILQAHEKEVVNDINNFHINERFLPRIKLDQSIKAISRIDECIESDVILLAPPAQFFRSICETLAEDYPPKLPAIICSKGIEKGSCALMSEIFTEILPGRPISVLSGPSFAMEVANNLPTAVTLACDDEIVVAIGGSPGGRAHARTGDRYQDMKEMGIKNPK